MAALQGQLTHLARRGVEVVTGDLPKMSMAMDRDELMQMQQGQWNDLFNKLPVWGIIVVGITFILFYTLMASVSYTIGRVVMTLAMIETPTVDYIPISTLESFDPTSKDDAILEIDGEPHTVVKNRPITSSIRGTIRHLTRHAGFWSRWRGLGHAIIYTLAFCVIKYPVKAVLGWLPLSETFADVIASVLLAQMHCAWTHKMIAVSSQKSFLARFPSRSVWRQLWIPNVVAASCVQVSIEVMRIFIRALAYPAFDHQKQQIVNSWWVLVLKAFAIIALGFFLLFFIVLPNYAALTRIEATLLSDDEDTIVPFDRTFGGKVTPVIVGGSGFRYVKEVCQTFDREARMRIIKLYLKMMVISFVMIVVTLHVVSFEVFFIIWPAAKEAAKNAGARAFKL